MSRRRIAPIRQRRLEDPTLRFSLFLRFTILSRILTSSWRLSRKRVSTNSMCDDWPVGISIFVRICRLAVGTPPLGPISDAVVHGASVQGT